MISMAQSLLVFFVALELLSIPALHPLRLGAAPPRVARVGTQVPDHRLARLGDPALRPRVRLRSVGVDRVRRDRDGDRRLGRRRPAAADRDRAGRDRARVQALGRAVSPVDAGRLRGRPDPGDRVHGGGDEGGRLLRRRPLLRRRARSGDRQLAAGAGGAGGGLDRRRQRGRARPELAQAPARLLGHRPGRLHARRRRRRHRGGRQRADLLPRRLRDGEPAGVRGRSRSASARRRSATTSASVEGLGARAPRARHA